MLVAETREHLHYIVNDFERMSYCMRLKINVGNSKGLVVKMIRGVVVRRGG